MQTSRGHTYKPVESSKDSGLSSHSFLRSCQQCLKATFSTILFLEINFSSEQENPQDIRLEENLRHTEPYFLLKVFSDFFFINLPWNILLHENQCNAGTNKLQIVAQTKLKDIREYLSYVHKVHIVFLFITFYPCNNSHKKSSYFCTWEWKIV